jgi:hypothetical protein
LKTLREALYLTGITVDSRGNREAETTIGGGEMSTLRQLVEWTQVLSEQGHEVSEEELTAFCMLGHYRAAETIERLVREGDQLKHESEADGGEIE